MAQYRVLQVTPSSWELDAAYEGGWRFVGKFDTLDAAQTKMSELVTVAAWHPPAPTYYDAKGQAVVTEVDNATT
jgi:hypothetical protein